MTKKFTFLRLLLFAINTFAQDTYVFFGSYNDNEVKEGIYVYQLDTVSGRLSKVTSVKVGNPSYLTLSPNGQFLYACTNTKTANEGSVSAYKFDPKNRKLNFINKQDSGGENPVYVTVDASGKWLVNANYTEASVSVHPLNEDGSIGIFTHNLKYNDSSINQERQAAAHIHAAVFAPDYKYIFFPDLGADKIRAYTFNAENSQPLENISHPFIVTTPGSGPRHLTFHPNGKFAYCIEEMGGAVSAYNYLNGTLYRLQRVYTHPETLPEGFESSDVQISPDGKFLYAANRGNENNIAIFSIAENGILKLVSYQSAHGYHPRTLAIDPSGKFLITTNVNSSNVIVFRRDAESGLLTKTGKAIKIDHVSCVKIQRY
jgi:6-phosphogluconolactonase